jgi:hypothetical protein
MRCSTPKVMLANHIAERIWPGWQSFQIYISQELRHRAQVNLANLANSATHMYLANMTAPEMVGLRSAVPAGSSR